MDNPFKSPAVLSLCTGMRGLERGIERAIGPVRTVAYVEIEAFVIANLVRQMEQGVLAPTPVWSNLKTFPGEQFYGKLHGITGGYPCQPFSSAGLRKGTDDPRHLWPFIKGIVKKSRPVWVFFENVEGHLSLGLEVVLKDLRQLGYQAEVGIFSAEEVGAPHRRNRVFILGLENSFLIGMRGWNDEQRENWRREIQTSRPGELGDTNLKSSWQNQERFHSKIASASGQLGDSEYEPINSSIGRVLGESDRTSSKLDNSSVFGLGSEYEVSTRGHSIESAGEDLANGVMAITDDERSQAEWSYRESIKQADFGVTRNAISGNWPARPGFPQHEWEAPRVESSMGYAINGYNFREDLLRMAGNGVVEQTAEVAFRTLLEKHGII